MKSWIIYALTAVGLWGSWGFCGKLASRSLAPQNLLMLACLGSLTVFPLYAALFFKHLEFSWQRADCYYALIGGAAGALGGLFFYLAIAKGEASLVVPVTAIYPVVTLALACIFLKEPLSVQKGIGIALAVLGVCLLSR
jgi:transporter family protein